MIDIDLKVDEPRWNELADLEKHISDALHAAEAVAGQAGEVSLLLTNDPAMLALNAQFRGKDKPTDVLSFPADAMDAPFLGDIAVGYQISRGDAEKQGKALCDHLAHLIIHGYLHLIGHDHMEDTDAEQMELLEKRALASLGIADPYSAP